MSKHEEEEEQRDKKKPLQQQQQQWQPFSLGLRFRVFVCLGDSCSSKLIKPVLMITALKESQNFLAPKYGLRDLSSNSGEEVGQNEKLEREKD
jgi:hypothetical protein